MSVWRDGGPTFRGFPSYDMPNTERVNSPDSVAAILNAISQWGQDPTKRTPTGGGMPLPGGGNPPPPVFDPGKIMSPSEIVAAASGSSAGAGAGASTLMGMPLPLALELIRGGFNFLGGAMAPDPQERQSFAGEGGERGRLIDPRNSLYTANRSALEMTRALAKQASQPIQMRSPMPGKTPSINVPGVPFALGGAGFNMPPMAELPGLDLDGLLAMLDQLLTAPPPSEVTGGGRTGQPPRMRVIGGGAFGPIAVPNPGSFRDPRNM